MTTAPGKETVNEVHPAHWRALWISDIHLGTAGCKAEFLLDFLDHNESDTLYLVGDIVDGWQLRKHWHWPRAHNDVIQRILRKARNGTRVVFIPGNHDEFAREFAGYAFGDIEILDEDVHVTAKGLRLLVLHGDQFDGVIEHARWLAFVGDWGYRMLLGANTAINRVRRKFGFGYWSFSAAVKVKVKNALQFIENFEQAVADEARRRGVVEVALDAHPMDDRIRDHRHQRRLADGGRALGAEGAEGLEDVRDLDAVLERPMVAGGDDRAVGDGVGVGDADLDQVRAPADQLVDQDRRGGQVGVAGREERHQGPSALGLEASEESVNAIHGGFVGR